MRHGSRGPAWGGMSGTSGSKRVRGRGANRPMAATRRARLVLGEGLRLMAAGGAAGLAAAAGLAWLMRAMLFEVAPLDPAAFAAAALMLCGFAMAACYIPARRASRVDPMEALRVEV